MRRLAAGLGLLLLLALSMLGAVAVVTARPADPTLWPAPPDARRVDIVVTSNGYHAGVALPRAALAELASERGYPAIIAVTQRFAPFEWIEFGWGDREFYRAVPTAADVTLSLALRALFAPGNTTVVHVAGLNADPEHAFSSAEFVRASLSTAGFDRLLAKLDATFVAPQGGALPDFGPGLYGASLFYPANGTFSILHVCNHWIDDLLGAAGLPTAPVLATLPAGLMLNLRWRAGLRPTASPR